MRSRLEARWAAFFDQLEWPWIYEQLDLTGYIPDFVLQWPNPIIVEVKPAPLVDSLREFVAKIEASGWTGEAIILGSNPTQIDGTHPILGLIAEREPEPGGSLAWNWSPARVFFCLSCGNVSVFSEYYSWRCRVCGVDGGNAHIGVVNQEATKQTPVGFGENWTAASNRVQWSAR
jgi:hypothetical protein